MDDTRHSGFTLIELLVTISLVALLAGIAVPQMGRFVENARLLSAVEHLTSDLQQARNHAISYQRTVYFSFQRKNNQWCYGWGDRGSCDCNSNQQPSKNCIAGSKTQGRLHRQGSSEFSGIRLTLAGNTGQRTLQFSPLRGISTAGSVDLENTRDKVRIVVSPLGRIRKCSLKRGHSSC